MLVASRMNRNPVTVSPSDTLATADARMQAGNFRHLPVVKDGKLLGMISDHDIRAHQGHLRDTRVTGAMTDNALTIPADAALEDAAEILLERKIGALPVLEGDKLAGIITTTDLLGALVELLGVSETNAFRMDLMIEASGAHDLAHAVQIVQAAGGEVLGLGTYREQWKERRVCYTVIRCDNAQHIEDSLTAAGFDVLGRH